MPGVPAFLLLNAGAIAGAVLVARSLMPDTRPERRVFAALCGYLVMVHSLVLGAGLLGWLTVGGVAACLGIVLAVAIWNARRERHGAVSSRAAAPGFTAWSIAGPAVAAGAFAVWLWPHVAGATRLWIWDDYTYHLVYPALWLREHAIAAVPPEHAFTMQAWYPLSASVVATWFMLPFAGARGDALAWVSLTGVLYGAIVACGAAELLARLGARRGAWAVPLALFATSARTGVMASSFSDADLGHAAALFAALVFAVPRADVESDRDVRVDAAYAALLCGLAVGIKVSALPAALIVVGLVAWRAAPRGARMRAARRVALAFAVAGLVTGGYWYVRNVVHTGNPFYPAAFLGAPGTAFPHTTLREYAREYGVARAVSDALAVYLNWPRPHALLAVGGLLGVAASCLARRRATARPQAFFATGALAITVVTLVLLPSMPYSAGNGMTFVAGFVHWDSMRYVALLPVLGWVSLAVVLDAGAGAPAWRTLAAALVMAAALAASPFTREQGALVLVGAAVVVLAVGRHLGAFRWSARVVAPWIAGARARVTAALAVMLVAAGLALAHGPKAATTAASVHREPLFGAAAAVLDRQPAGTRIAVYGDQWIYPMFGGAHHLVPVRADGNGHVATTPIGDAMAPGPLEVHPWRFVANLAAARIGLVAVVHLPHPGRSAEWPPQAAALEAAGGARLIYRDRAVGIWRVQDDASPRAPAPRGRPDVRVPAAPRPRA
jgi:hypothetical protein